MKTFHIIFRAELGGGFTAMVPSLPGCVSFGETLSEAQTMIDEAIILYLETVKETDFSDDTNTLIQTKTIAYA